MTITLKSLNGAIKRQEDAIKTLNTEIEKIVKPFDSKIKKLEIQKNLIHNKKEEATKKLERKTHDNWVKLRELQNTYNDIKTKTEKKKWSKTVPQTEYEFEKWLAYKCDVDHITTISPTKLDNDVTIFGGTHGWRGGYKTYIAVKGKKIVGELYINGLDQGAGSFVNAEGTVNKRNITFETTKNGGDAKPFRTWKEAVARRIK